MNAPQTTKPPFWRRPLCALGMCGCRPYADEGGAGGQCVRCGKIVGYVDNATLRR